MLEDYVMEKSDYGKIKKLRTLHSIESIYEDVKRFTKSVKSEHSLRRWEILTEVRIGELMQAKLAFGAD